VYKHKLSSLFRKVKFKTEFLKYLNLFKGNKTKILHTKKLTVIYGLKQAVKFISWTRSWTFI